MKFIISIALLFSSLNLSAKELVIEGKPVHPGCIYELTTKVNGDNIVNTVHLTRTDLRGCLDSNKYSQKVKTNNGGHLIHDKELFGNGAFSYSVLANMGDLYALKALDISGATYVGASVLIVKKVTKELVYFKESGKKKEVKVVSLELLGEMPSKADEKEALKYLKAI